MRRFGLTASALVGLGVAAIVASCSDGGPPESVGGPLPDAPVLTTGSLSGGGWNTTVEAAAGSGKVSVCHSGNGKHYTQLSLPAPAVRAHLGDPETGGGKHSFDFRVSDATPCPPSGDNTVGLVRVCKIAGNGVTAGTNFTFTLSATGVSDKSVTVAAGTGTGNCVDAKSYASGTTVTVKETAQQGVTTSNIAVAPTGALQGSPDLAAGSVVVVTGTTPTTVTYTNTAGTGGTTGTLVVCKVAGTGITVGTSYSFTAGTLAATAPAGAAPDGTCGTAVTLPAGPVTVTETGAATSVVTAITGTPAVTNPSLTGRSATIAITAGQEARITFTNVASTAANSGSLIICKVAGTGVAAGTSFGFTAGGQTATVAAGAAPNGTCLTTPLTVGAGTLTVSENAVTGTSVTTVTATNGATNALVSSDLPNRRANVTITAGQTTTVTFTNAAP